jgi:hypothetical protein
VLGGAHRPRQKLAGTSSANQTFSLPS